MISMMSHMSRFGDGLECVKVGKNEFIEFLRFIEKHYGYDFQNAKDDYDKAFSDEKYLYAVCWLNMKNELQIDHTFKPFNPNYTTYDKLKEESCYVEES